MSSIRTIATSVGSVLAIAAIVAGCERPPQNSEQTGYRGLGMVQVTNPRLAGDLADRNVPPKALDAARATGQKASQLYKNVRVLGDLSEEQLTRVMMAMTEWVSPDQGCGYCHNEADLADGSKYTHAVARRMLQMTKDINTNFRNHVGQTGVTCYTCHRGQPVPREIWFNTPEGGSGMLGNRGGQNAPVPQVGYTTLPVSAGFASTLAGKDAARVVAQTALPTGPGKSIQATENVYGLMMHMSAGLGVNCTFCHNTRSFTSWDASSPQRVTAWHGINMTRTLNATYLDPLRTTYPPERLGPLGDAPKAMCATCHHGQSKPLAGAQMLKDYLELNAVPTPAAGAPAPAPAAPGQAPAPKR
jgi:photosynthetic reaction center cytochrome c subunit